MSNIQNALDIRETKGSNFPSDAVREELLRRPAEKLLALV